jgi:hypothetical protein
MFQKLFLGSMGFEPMTTTKPNNLRNGPLPMHQIISYVIKPTILNIFQSIVWRVERGWGLAPTHVSTHGLYDQPLKEGAGA